MRILIDWSSSWGDIMGYRQARWEEPLFSELTSNPEELQLPDELGELKREELFIPDVSELQVARHFTRLSQMNFGIESGFYPLGSCTMKYNPKLGEELAALVLGQHPLQDGSTVQGTLQLLYELEIMLREIGGMDRVSLQPAAGAHGELAAMLMIKKYFQDRGEKREKVLIPDTAHGTNPASAAMAGYRVLTIPSDEKGCMDIRRLEESLDEDVAALMLTNPNTLGIFEDDILKIAEMVHDQGASLYYDGANLNALMGWIRPGEMGFDLMHFNLHKTFSTPHGGGGPGSGPIGARGEFVDYLPVPLIGLCDEIYKLDYDLPRSIGKVKSFYGNIGPLLKAYVYIKCLGKEGVKEASTQAVLNANYLKEKVKNYLEIPYKGLKKHEFVASSPRKKAVDLAKALLDRGYGAPTIYFPQIVEEALMIEPTESESKGEIDDFALALGEIVSCEETEKSPKNTSVKRVDEVLAARKPKLTWKDFSTSR
jgi:glycine dehydrogenase subunit 2